MSGSIAFSRQPVRWPTHASRLLAVIGLCIGASACTSLRYYAHVAHGQASLLTRREAVADLVANPRTDEKLRARLQQAQAARAFASDHLDLPRNRSYTSYVELGRPYVTWNVFATPEFSVEPITHCFPFAGCVAYQGYFDRKRAERAAAHLAARGDDTQVEGAAAYSTLGWFADPILSSMLRWSDDELDSTIFHELAHQKLYVGDDTAFNESYATFVQEQGLREWRAVRNMAPPDDSERARDGEFTQLMLDLRERLRKLYAQELPADTKRARKQAEIAAFRERYALLRDTNWKGDRRYDRWVDAPINNASLVPFGLYDRWVPAFAELFRQAGQAWPVFYAKVRELAVAAKRERERRLAELIAGQAGAVTAFPPQHERRSADP